MDVDADSALKRAESPVPKAGSRPVTFWECDNAARSLLVGERILLNHVPDFHKFEMGPEF